MVLYVILSSLYMYSNQNNPIYKFYQNFINKDGNSRKQDISREVYIVLSGLLSSQPFELILSPLPLFPQVFPSIVQPATITPEYQAIDSKRKTLIAYDHCYS